MRSSSEFFSTKLQKSHIIQKKLIKLVDLIVDLKNKKDNTSTLEFEIDQIVYQLYGLTDDEIAIVEGKK